MPTCPPPEDILNGVNIFSGRANERPCRNALTELMESAISCIVGKVGKSRIIRRELPTRPTGCGREERTALDKNILWVAAKRAFALAPQNRFFAMRLPRRIAANFKLMRNRRNHHMIDSLPEWLSICTKTASDNAKIAPDDPGARGELNVKADHSSVAFNIHKSSGIAMMQPSMISSSSIVTRTSTS